MADNASGIAENLQENSQLNYPEITGKKQRGAKQLNVAEVQRILELRIKGLSPNAIAEQTGHHHSTIQRYLTEAVSGHPLTPLDERVVKLRERMLKATEFDLKGSLLGDLVLLDEYRDQMAKAIAEGRVPNTCDSQELKRVIDAKATIARLPGELQKKTTDVDDQIQGRLKEQEREIRALGVTDFTVVEDEGVDGELEQEGGGEGRESGDPEPNSTDGAGESQNGA